MSFMVLIHICGNELCVCDFGLVLCAAFTVGSYIFYKLLMKSMNRSGNYLARAGVAGKWWYPRIL